jgi:hypothetical protein
MVVIPRMIAAGVDRSKVRIATQKQFEKINAKLREYLQRELIKLIIIWSGTPHHRVQLGAVAKHHLRSPGR